jgi:hypothetical protein
MSEANIQSIYLLADHLDAALATGEDLLKENMELTRFTPDTPSDDMREAHGMLRDFVDRIRMLELRLCARIVRARDLAAEVSAHDPRLEPFARMFASGTVPLVEAMADLGDTTDQDFETGAQALAYLRSRAFIAADAAGCEDIQELRGQEDILISAQIRIGTLLDLVAAFLDAVEQHHDIYGNQDTDEVGEEVPATAPTPEGGAQLAQAEPAAPIENAVDRAIAEPDASEAVAVRQETAAPADAAALAVAEKTATLAVDAVEMPAAHEADADEPAAVSSKRETTSEQAADTGPDTDMAAASGSKTAEPPQKDRKSSSLMERLKLAS